MVLSLLSWYVLNRLAKSNRIQRIVLLYRNQIQIQIHLHLPRLCNATLFSQSIFSESLCVIQISK